MAIFIELRCDQMYLLSIAGTAIDIPSFNRNTTVGEVVDVLNNTNTYQSSDMDATKVILFIQLITRVMRALLLI